MTEDLVHRFEAMGLTTGIDLHRLQRAREALQAGLPGEPVYGMTPEAGLGKGFVHADGRRPPAERLASDGAPP